jgi:hypothetical protein
MNKADLDLMSTSERLRVCAELGATVTGWGPISEDSTVFAQSALARGLFSEREWSDDKIREHLHVLHSLGRWAQYGFNVFELAPDFAAGLLLTDPAPLEEELKFPFPCFFVRLPPGIVPMFSDGKQLWAEGVWCHRFKSTHRSLGEHTDFFRWTIERKSLSLWRDRFPTNLDDPEDNSYYNLTLEGDPPYVPEDDIALDKALRIVKNWMFGQNVKLRPELRRLASEFALAQSKDHAVPGWKLRVQHVVRGHFKFQPHGEGRTQRKRIWVEPYWRGPEGTAAWAHIYQADKV